MCLKCKKCIFSLSQGTNFQTFWVSMPPDPPRCAAQNLSGPEPPGFGLNQVGRSVLVTGPRFLLFTDQYFFIGTKGQLDTLNLNISLLFAKTILIDEI